MNPAEESAIQDFLQILEEHRKNCEQRGKYAEAEIAKNRLEDIKKQEECRKVEVLRARHLAERLGVEEANMLEYNQFTRTWDKTMADYEMNAQNALDSMKQKHTEGLEEFRRQLLAKHMKPKFSTELLNYRKIQDHLAKAKDYTEANRVKVKADALEVLDMEKWQQKRQECISQQEENYKQQKLQEYTALQKRLQTGREAQKKQRSLELDRLSQRYQNVKKELEAQHNLERSRIEKQYYQQKVVLP